MFHFSSILTTTWTVRRRNDITTTPKVAYSESKVFQNMKAKFDTFRDHLHTLSFPNLKKSKI